MSHQPSADEQELEVWDSTATSTSSEEGTTTSSMAPAAGPSVGTTFPEDLIKLILSFLLYQSSENGYEKRRQLHPHFDYAALSSLKLVCRGWEAHIWSSHPDVTVTVRVGDKRMLNLVLNKLSTSARISHLYALIDYDNRVSDLYLLESAVAARPAPNYRIEELTVEMIFNDLDPTPSYSTQTINISSLSFPRKINMVNVFSSAGGNRLTIPNRFNTISISEE